MNDQQLWQHGLQALNEQLQISTPAKKLQLMELLTKYNRGKELLVAITQAINSESICRECAGQCCLNGKYRMNVLDALSLQVSDIKISPDFSQKPLCPCGTATGCKLEPAFRPADCVFFVCSAIDHCLSVTDRNKLEACEKTLRGCLSSASQMLGISVSKPLLLWAEKEPNN